MTTPSLDQARYYLSRIEVNGVSPRVVGAAELACAAAYSAGWHAAQRGNEYTNPFMDDEPGDKK